MRSIPTCWRACCSPPWDRLTRKKRRRGARGARPSFRGAGARLGDALAATAKAASKLAQARNRLEDAARRADTRGWVMARLRSEDHTSELQSLMRISYSAFGLKNKD